MVMRVDPFAEMERWMRGGSQGREPGWVPVDAYRVGDRVFVHFDLPGVDPDSIEVTVEERALTVSAQRSWNVPEDVVLVARERPVGRLSRRFFLGEALDPAGIEAGYDHGVLTITIPVAEHARPRRIAVQSTQEALTV